MLQKIMIPIDGSADGDRALGFAAELALAQGAEALLVRVIEPVSWVGAAGDYAATPEAMQELLERTEADARSAVANRAEALAVQGVHARTLVVRGSPAGALLDCIDEERPDLVVMATHGRTGLTRFALGSVTDRVVREGSAPVLVVRRSTEPTHHLRTAVLMLDGSSVAEEALPLVRQLAHKPLQRIKLLRVVSDPTDRQSATTYLESIARALAADGLETEIIIDVGTPDRIVWSTALEADLVVLCTHGEGGFKRLRHGSVAEHVIREVDRPALLVRASAGAGG